MSRHVSRQKLIIDDLTQEVVGIYPQAFELRDGEDGLSVNHLEHFEGSHEEQVRQIMRDLKATRTVGGKSGFGVLNVDRVTAIGRQHGHSLATYEKALENNPSHSEIRGLPADRQPLELAQALADDAFEEFFLASSL